MVIFKLQYVPACLPPFGALALNKGRTFRCRAAAPQPGRPGLYEFLHPLTWRAAVGRFQLRTVRLEDLRNMSPTFVAESANVLRDRGGLSGWQKLRAKQLLAADLNSPIALKDVATDCGISVGHFNRAFRRSTGYSPHQWLIRYRIQRAKNLLQETSSSLIAIALECGFSDQSHFTRMFMRHVGETPGRWRRTWATGTAG